MASRLAQQHAAQQRPPYLVLSSGPSNQISKGYSTHSYGGSSMASWKEIERVRKDVLEAKAIATRLLKFHVSDFTEWEKDFLESIIKRNNDYELTTRQVEKLLQIRDDTEELAEFRGFSIKLLTKQVFEARLDLSETDEEWIKKLMTRQSDTIMRKHIGRLMRCARELYIIEGDEAAA
jgi:hypothetical protein